jgi:hypothetical protein
MVADPPLTCAAGSIGTVGDVFVLLHAPALGPASWAPVASALTKGGHQVVVPALAGFTSGRPPYVAQLIRQAVAQLPVTSADHMVLVPHSGAGVFAPYLAAAGPAAAMKVVFTDAALPPAAPGPATVVDAGFLPFLRGLAVDGMVPPWPDWWPDEDLSPLFPDADTRRTVAAEAPALPLAFYTEPLPPVPDAWADCRCGFLQFSVGYREQAAAARDRGWPVRELAGEHLHMLIEPDAVAAALVGLAAAATRARHER